MASIADSISASIADSIAADHDNILSIVSDRYGLDLNNLKTCFKFSDDMVTITEPRNPKKLTSRKIAINRCEGRIWANHKIIYIDNKWQYGEQCKRQKYGKGQYCQVHTNSLTHGNIHNDPPHNHYEKYKYKYNYKS